MRNENVQSTTSNSIVRSRRVSSLKVCILDQLQFNKIWLISGPFNCLTLITPGEEFDSAWWGPAATKSYPASQCSIKLLLRCAPWKRLHHRTGSGEAVTHCKYVSLPFVQILFLLAFSTNFSARLMKWLRFKFQELECGMLIEFQSKL